ncbi:nuclear transport factor 2 family protein [Streptomyces lasiicapitis]|uniref:nuclear transport factor 2 family protein n=1 Tax=Streptomyces lasiicapitis TaxID=1923961 RepID=UPI003317FF5E
MTCPGPDASATERTRAVVREFLIRMAAGDPDDIALMFAEKIDWHIAPNPAAPWTRPRTTRADAADHFRELAAGMVPDPDRVRTDTVIADGVHGVITGHLAGRVRASGKPYSSPFAVHFVVEDGLITGFHVYEDSLAIAAACTP